MDVITTESLVIVAISWFDWRGWAWRDCIDDQLDSATAIGSTTILRMVNRIAVLIGRMKKLEKQSQALGCGGIKQEGTRKVPLVCQLHPLPRTSLIISDRVTGSKDSQGVARRSSIMEKKMNNLEIILLNKIYFL